MAEEADVICADFALVSILSIVFLDDPCIGEYIQLRRTKAIGDNATLVRSYHCPAKESFDNVGDKSSIRGSSEVSLAERLLVLASIFIHILASI